MCSTREVRSARPVLSAIARAAGISVLVVAGFPGRPAVADDIPLRNRTVPSERRGAVSTLGDAGSPGVFVPFTPCRVADTWAGFGFTGSYGPPTIGGGTTRTMNVVTGPCAGIAPNATAVSLNFTVTNTQGAGFISVYPAGGSAPTVSTLNYVAGQTLANAAIVGYNFSNVNGSHGLGGYAGGTGSVQGVQGEIGTTAGVFSAGVHGIATNRDKNFGVLGDVTGYSGGTYYGAQPGAGVMGRGTLRGVVGYANAPLVGGTTSGAIGAVLSSGGTVDVAGVIGLVYRATGEKYGVFYNGGLGGFGTKSFLEPHPSDPERIVRYYSLEGPESGTYCRGSAATSGGVAVLELSDTFRWVTDVEGLTVQVTPTGADFVQVRVEKKELDRVVVRTSKDTTFDWVVQGIRHAYKDAEVTPRSELLRPEGPDATIPAFLSADERKRVVASGLYNADGTVNLRTAERLGWTREWEARAREAERK